MRNAGLTELTAIELISAGKTLIWQWLPLFCTVLWVCMILFALRTTPKSEPEKWARNCETEENKKPNLTKFRYSPIIRNRRLYRIENNHPFDSANRFRAIISGESILIVLSISSMCVPAS